MFKALLGLLLFSFLAAPGFQSFCQQTDSPNQDEWVALFRSGQQDMRNGQFTSAIQNFSKALSLHPGMVEAEVNLGLAYSAAGEYKLAVAVLSEAASRRPELLAANLFLGLSYMKLGEPEKAALALEQALRIDPSNRQAKRALAEALLAQGRYRQATAQFVSLADAQPDKATALFDLGQDYLHMVAKLTGELSQKYNNSARSLRFAGDVLGERNLWKDAADDYRKALLKSTGQPQSSLHAALGHALLESGKTGSAESEFTAALAHDPDNFNALLGTAEARLDQGDASAALPAVNQVSGQTPELLPWALASFTPRLSAADAQRMAAQLGTGAPSIAKEFLLTALFRAAGETDKAQNEQEALQNAVKQAQAVGAPVDGAASACKNHQERWCAQYLASQRQLSLDDLYTLGKAFFDLHQDQPAALAFSTLLSDSKSDIRAIYWLDRSYLRLSDACFDRLSSSYPGTWMAFELKGDALRARQSDLEAIAAYRQAEKLNPGNAGIHQELAELLLKKNQTGPGKEELEAALRLDPSSARGLYLLGNLYVYEQQPARGIPYLRAALRYDPMLMEARPALGKAYLRTGKPALAAVQFEQSLAMDHYGDLHYMLSEAYRQEGKTQLAAQALAKSQAMRRRSQLEDQAKVMGTSTH